VELRSGTYIFAPDPEYHPLLSTVFGLLSTTAQTDFSHVVQSLSTGRFGLPADTALFLLSALAYGGLITLLKGGRTISLEFFKLTAIENADAVAPGGIIGKHDRQTLMETCGFLSPAEGWGSFGLLQQREAWQAVVKFRKWAEKAAVDIEIRLADVAEFSAFEAFDLEALRSQLKALKTLCAEIKISITLNACERFSAARLSNLCSSITMCITRLSIG
jgi:hypothetical protein